MKANPLYTVFLLILCAICLFGIYTSAQETKPIPPLLPTLSELSQLKAENFKLKIQLSQCQVDLLSFKSSTDLTNYQASLEGSFKKELGCKTTDKFNWALLKCESNDVKKDIK